MLKSLFAIHTHLFQKLHRLAVSRASGRQKPASFVFRLWVFRLCVGSLLLILICTLFPYNFTVEHLSLKIVVRNLTDSTDLRDFLANVVLFLPFAFSFTDVLKQTVLNPQKRRSVLITCLVLITSMALSIAVEGHRYFYPPEIPP